MIIYREGQEIELTKDELFDAYMEQKYLFTRDVILGWLEYNDISECFASIKEEIIKDKKFIENAIESYSDYEEQESEFDFHVREAVKEAFLRYVEENNFTWEFPNGIRVEKKIFDRDLCYFEVYKIKNNKHLGDIYPDGIKDARECIKNLCDGNDPISYMWEDGRGHGCSIDGWGEEAEE